MHGGTSVSDRFQRLFWRDMMTVGTAINLATGLAALALFLNDAPAWLATAVFLSPIPYNLYLTISVWQAAAGRRGEAAYRLAALCWLVIVFFI